MSYYLGGQTVVNAGWLSPTAVFLDFVTTYASGFVWQLYANRLLIGSTRKPGQTRVVGQLMANVSPAPLTLVRVDAANFNTDYSAFLPAKPWNRFELLWTTSASVGVDHFDIVSGRTAGAAVDSTNVLAKVPFIGDGAYSFQLDPLPAGNWNLGVIPRSNSTPLGTAGTMLTTAIVVVLPPNDIVLNSQTGQRFSLSASGGVVTASFVYG